jgi:Actin-like ATPase involved in cell morphogenesis
MKRNNIFIIEIGSSFTTVYKNGALLREPTVAVIRKSAGGPELVAAGEEALSLQGKLDERSSFIRVVEDGAVINAEAAALMLKKFLNKVIPNKAFKTPEIIAAVPAGLSMAERENVEAAIVKSGYKNVTLKESISGLVPFVDRRGQAAIDIGGGMTETGVLDHTGIVSACSLNVGGRKIDEKIAERVLDAYNLKISSKTAEDLKIRIGSLYENDTSVAEAVGRDVIDGELKMVEISAESIRPAISNIYKTILEVTESLLTTIPRKTLSDVTFRGLYLAGGGALIGGLSDFIAKYLKIPAIIHPEPETAALAGLYMQFANE